MLRTFASLTFASRTFASRTLLGAALSLLSSPPQATTAAGASRSAIADVTIASLLGTGFSLLRLNYKNGFGDGEKKG